MTLQPGQQTITIHILPNEVKTTRQWNLVNRLYQEKYFSSKVMQIIRQGD